MTKTRTATAIVADVWTAYDRDRETQVRISRSKATCAGPDGVQFHAPGWRPMVFRSVDAAIRKIEAHPGFVRWAA